MLNQKRAGKISSSEVYRMYESKAVKETYIDEIRMFDLFQQTDVEKDVFNFKWGHLLENYLHDKTDHFKGYVNQNQEINATIFSKRNIRHCGTPDQYTIQNDYIVVSETKCPVTLKGLHNLIFPFYSSGKFMEVDGNKAIQLIKEKSKEGRKYFEQIISNGVLLEEELGVSCNYGELVVFMPYSNDISKITRYADEVFSSYYYPILTGTDETLPCIKNLKNDSFYELEDVYPVKDVHKIRFDISEDMKDSFRKDLDLFTKTVFPTQN